MLYTVGALHSMFPGFRRLAVIAPFLPSGFPLPLGKFVPGLLLHALLAVHLPVFLDHIPLAFSHPCRTGASLSIPLHHGAAAGATVPSPAALCQG
jgi:hypothetical protein